MKSGRDDAFESSLRNSPKNSPRGELPGELEASEPAQALILEHSEEERLDDILTNEEIEEIRAEARKKAQAEIKQKRKRAFEQAALDEARRDAGTMPEDEEFRAEMEELVPIFIDLPRLRKANGGDIEPDPIIIDQRIFMSGHSYTVTRGLAIYIYDLMDRCRRHVNQVDGRSRTYYNGSTMMYQGGVAAGGGGGPSFDSIHRRAK